MTEDDRTSEEVPDVNDGTLRDVVGTLSALPTVTEADVQRVVARVAADAVDSGRHEEHWWAVGNSDGSPSSGAHGVRPAPARWFSAIPMAAAATLVLAAGIAGFALRGVIASHIAPMRGEVATSAPGVATDAVPVHAVAPDRNAEAPISTQFVLEAPGAERVSLVGAFNAWDERATPLVRDRATGLWTVTVPLAPGRHVYGFMVDDSALTLDPRAPTTRDPELGTNASVILVGTP